MKFGYILYVTLLLTSVGFALDSPENTGEHKSLKEKEIGRETGKEDDREDFSAYVKVREKVSQLAVELASNRLAEVSCAYVKAGESSYYDSREYRELCAVARDAWPFLEKEWSRIIALPKSVEREKRLRVLVGCWSRSREKRALGLLSRYVIQEKKREIMPTVERISGKYHGRHAEMYEDDLKILDKNFENWWKGYQSLWEGEMGRREERDNLFRQVK